MNQPAPPGRPQAEAAQHLDPARDGTRRAVLVSGAPATGKSTLGAALAPRLGAALLDLDVATGPLMDVIAAQTGLTDPSDPRLAALTRDARYRTLFELAGANLRAGRPVVLVAPFTAERRSADSWHSARARLQASGARASLVWLHLPATELLARMHARGAERDGAKLADTDAYLAGLDLAEPIGPHLGLDARIATADLVAAVLEHLA